MVLTVEIRDIRRPKFLCFWTFPLNPLGDARQDIPASAPLVQVMGATNRQFAISRPFGRGAKHIPSASVFDDRRVVRSFDITGDADRLRQSRGSLGVNWGRGGHACKRGYKDEQNCRSCFQGQAPSRNARTRSAMTFFQRLSSATWRSIP